MSIVSSLNMPASNLLHPLVHSDSSSSLQRKRFLDDLDDENDTKRVRTTPHSPALVPSSSSADFGRRPAQSPTPPPSSSKLPLSPPNVHSSIITPESPLTQLAAPVQHIENVTPLLSIPTVVASSSSSSPTTASITVAPLLSTPTSSQTLPHLPPVSTLTHDIKQKDIKLPSLKDLANGDRFAGITRYSLDYPDTCVNDDDWRMNLEVWIEQNFPEKFNNLKNMLRFDKPGFELLNDAIFLTELKEQLDHQQKPEFNSRISTKMVQQKRDGSLYTRRASSDNLSEVMRTSSPYGTRILPHPQNHKNSQSSPIAPTTQLHTSSSSSNPSSSTAYPYTTNNYTYSQIQSPTSPTSKTSHQHPSKSSPTTASASTSTSTSTAQRAWSGHHKLDQQPVVLNNNTSFIHTQTHKGPNHTYTIHHHNMYKRVCISCGTDQSPCWRPSWSVNAGQLCNSCGLRYKKTGARCVEKDCCRIPAKGEWLAMENRGKLSIKKKDGSLVLAYKCLHCGGEVATVTKEEK